MSRTRLLSSPVVPILLLAAAVAARGQNTHPALADRLSWFNYTMDYAGGVAEARARPHELRDGRAMAWYVLLLARDDEYTASLTLADSMMAADRASRWAWFARTAALVYYSYGDSSAAALAASDSMYARASHDPDVIWLYVATAIRSDRAKDVTPIVDSILAHDPSATRFLVERGDAAWSAAERTQPPNQAARDSAQAFYAKARALDSADVRAWGTAGNNLLSGGSVSEAVPLLRRAVELAPLSLRVNEYYWRALHVLHAREPDRTKAEVVPAIERLLAARGSDPAVLGEIRDEYASLAMPDSQRGIEQRVLRDFPRSPAAEWVLVSRYRTIGAKLRDTTVHDSTLKSTYREALLAFIRMPTHVNERLLGDAYRELFTVSDSMTPPDTLLSIILGMERYEGINPQITYAQGAIALADRGVHFDQAERLARQGAVAGRQRVEQSHYPDAAMFAQVRDYMASIMADALGWVYFREGRVKDAELQLRQALKLYPKEPTTLNHVGRFFEAAGAMDSAEAYYVRGALVPTLGRNPNRDALRKLYVQRHGSAEGYDGYYASIREEDRARRRTEVAAGLKATRDSLPAFVLATLAGDTVRSTSLAGHVAVINFWSTGCGPCVVEMPEMQRFWRQVASDTAVRLVTISSDDNLDSLRAWLRGRHYDFPVLVDAGYGGHVGVYAIPTTFFVDRSGRIAFLKEGWSEELAEEFGWRVDMLKAETSRH